jgi:polysaccharide biosynthesis protein PelA
MKKLIIFFILPFMIFTKVNNLKWLVYYGIPEISEKELLPYDVLVLDSVNPPNIEPSLKRKKQVLGYLGLGEVNEQNPFFRMVKQKNLVIKESPYFAGSYFVDIRSEIFKDIVLNKMIPYIISKGFNGLFYDQLDVSLDYEMNDPKKYGGMKEAAIDLVKSIRKKYPDLKLMLNRAYEILPDVGNDVDYVLLETLYTSYNFDTKSYYVRTKVNFEHQLSIMNKAKKQFSDLQFFSLDYWESTDKKMIKRIYEIERSKGLIPYVATINLDVIVKEP